MNPTQARIPRDSEVAPQLRSSHQRRRAELSIAALAWGDLRRTPAIVPSMVVHVHTRGVRELTSSAELARRVIVCTAQCLDFWRTSGPSGFPADGLEVRTFGPAGCRAFVVRSSQEVVQVDVAYALAGWVREWTREQCPGEPRVSDMAVSIALSSYFGGASIAEACEQARSFVVSRTVHPAQKGHRPVASLSVAS